MSFDYSVSPAVGFTPAPPNFTSGEQPANAAQMYSPPPPPAQPTPDSTPQPSVNYTPYTPPPPSATPTPPPMGGTNPATTAPANQDTSGGPSTQPNNVSPYTPDQPPSNYTPYTPAQSTLNYTPYTPDASPSTAPMGGTNPSIPATANQDTSGGPSLQPAMSGPNIPSAASASNGPGDLYESDGPQQDPVGGTKPPADTSQNNVVPQYANPSGGMQNTPSFDQYAPILMFNDTTPTPPLPPIGGTSPTGNAPTNQDTAGGLSLQPPNAQIVDAGALGQILQDMPLLERVEGAQVVTESAGILLGLEEAGFFVVNEVAGPAIAYVAAFVGWAETSDPERQRTELIESLDRLHIPYTLDDNGWPTGLPTLQGNMPTTP